MLWYKAWLETRLRFAICLLAITVVCLYTVKYGNQMAHPRTTFDFYYLVEHGAYVLIGYLWIAAISFLTAGGLLREKAVGAASFTLALPFSRRRLVGVRVAVCLIEAVALIVIPSIAICIEDSMIGKPYPLSQAWFHILLLASGGTVFFAIALLVASLMEGEFTAPLVSFCVAAWTAFALHDPPLAVRNTIWSQASQTYSPFHFMTGIAYFDSHTGLLRGPIPWVQAGIFVLLATLFIAASVKAIQMRDF
jgi:ABC-2 type transport system permease protein